MTKRGKYFAAPYDVPVGKQVNFKRLFFLNFTEHTQATPGLPMVHIYISVFVYYLKIHDIKDTFIEKFSLIHLYDWFLLVSFIQWFYASVTLLWTLIHEFTV